MMAPEHKVAAAALGVLVVASAVRLSLALHPTDLPPALPPSSDGPAALITMTGPQAGTALQAMDLPLPVIPGDAREAQRIAELLGSWDPHEQLWALEGGCWLDAGEAVGRDALQSTDPRTRAAGVAVLGCQLADPVPELVGLLGQDDDVVAVSAAMELARLDARDRASDVLAASERIEDPGLAVLAAWCAYTLGAPVERFEGSGRAGL